MNSFPKLAVFSLVILLFAPALKSRFPVSDVVIYFLPFVIFLCAVVVLNLLHTTFWFENLRVSLIYLLLLSPVMLAFMVGDAQSTSLLTSFVTNCILATMVVLFPWNYRSVHLFFWICALVGAVLAMHTLLFLGSDVALEQATDEQKTGYITVGVAVGFGCLASLYLVFTKPSALSILLLASTWMGLAAGRARGAFLLCVVISIAYLFFILSNKRVSIKSSRKYFIIGLLVFMVPLVAYSLLSIEQNKNRFARLIDGFSSEIAEGGRGPLMKEALDKISQSPVFGNGLGEYMGFYGHPHNMLLQYAVDAGIVGLILILGFLLKVSLTGLSAIVQHRENETNMACVALCFFLYMVSNMMKSGDAYLGREFFIASALPIVMYQLYRYFRTDIRQ